jgi:hypothetical protein
MPASGSTTSLFNKQRETTQHMRELADRKKEERLAELWKTELDKPSVMELV